MRAAGFEVRCRSEHRASTSPSLHARWSGKRLVRTSSLEKPDSTPTDMVASRVKMAPGYFEKGGENEGKALGRKLSTVLPANLDTYATPSAAAPLFFLPDNTKWRTHAGVKT